MVTRDNVPQGICPACGETVKRAEDAVWTCRHNLSADNPYKLPPLWTRGDYWYLSDDEWASMSHCLNEHEETRGYCEDDMPLHSACYDAGAY
jgi:hypothetical protein